MDGRGGGILLSTTCQESFVEETDGKVKRNNVKRDQKQIYKGDSTPF